MHSQGALCIALGAVATMKIAMGRLARLTGCLLRRRGAFTRVAVCYHYMYGRLARDESRQAITVIIQCPFICVCVAFSPPRFSSRLSFHRWFPQCDDKRRVRCIMMWAFDAWRNHCQLDDLMPMPRREIQMLAPRWWRVPVTFSVPVVVDGPAYVEVKGGERVTIIFPNM